MKTIGVFLVSVLSLAACSRADEEASKKLDQVLARLDSLEKKVDANGARVGAAGAAGAANPQAARPRPDPNTVYAIPVDANDPQKGASAAKVTIVEAYEYACPYCAMLAPTMAQVLEKYPKDVKIVTKQFVVHPQVATSAAYASCAANKQGKFAEYEHELWSRAWPSKDGQPRLEKDQLAPEALEKIAGDLRLDVGKFKADMASPECKQIVETKQREMSTFGVSGTPMIYVNGKPYQGQRTLDGMAAVIDAEIAKANQAIAAGTPVDQYYASITKGGKKSL